MPGHRKPSPSRQPTHTIGEDIYRRERHDERYAEQYAEQYDERYDERYEHDGPTTSSDRLARRAPLSSTTRSREAPRNAGNEGLITGPARPSTQISASYETVSQDRLGQQNARSQVTTRLPTLSGLLTKFINIPINQYDSCATFCRNQHQIWTEDPFPLYEAASYCVSSGSTAAIDRAEIALQRYFMLSGKWHGPSKNSEQDYLDNLTGSRARDFQGQLDSAVAKALRQLQEAATRTNMVQSTPQTSQLAHRPAGQSIATGLSRGDLGASLPRTRAVTDSRKAPSSQQLNPPIAGNVGQGSALRGQWDDLDTLGLPEPGPGPRKYVGPATDVGDTLKGSDKQDFLNRFHEGFRLQLGEPRIMAAFSIGCCFATVWHETYGTNLPPKLKDKVTEKPLKPGRFGPGFLTLSKSDGGSWIYSHVRRFIVVKRRHGFSIVIPITSYSRKGVSAKNIPMREKLAHTIVYSKGKDPLKLTGEPNFTKAPICINMVAGESLSEASRLYYAQPVTVEHNTKIKPIGHVIEADMKTLLQDYVYESESEN